MLCRFISINKDRSKEIVCGLAENSTAKDLPTLPEHYLGKQDEQKDDHHG
jgi:hypothetical protein